MIVVLNDGRTLVTQGPIQMVLDIRKSGALSQEIAEQTSKYIINEFNGLLEYMPKLKKTRYFKEPQEDFPEVLNKMIRAVNRSGYEDLNTLGAVAGSFADIALNKALELGATRVIINNGGDIAISDTTGKPFKVGIPYKVDNLEKQLVLNIDDKNIHGICTSGLGGRSLTKGIATAVVICGENSAISDACATFVANKTDVEDKNIIRSLAEDIDPETDIKGQIVTAKVDEVSEKKRYKALINGLTLAEKLYNKEIIKGAIILVGDTIAKHPENLKVEIL